MNSANVSYFDGFEVKFIPKEIKIWKASKLLQIIFTEYKQTIQ